MKSEVVYADYAATAPVSPRAAEILCKAASEVFGNPSSAHSIGRAARKSVERAREQVAALMGCLPEEVYFTSGGTEADNCAIRTFRGQTVAASALEHPAVLNSGVSALAASDENGVVIPSAFCKIIKNNRPALISLMYANNETGVIQPVRETAELAHSVGALFHCDAVQGFGHVMPSVGELDCDLMSVSGHKLHAPKGIGALYIRKEIAPRIVPLICGGGQERGLRSGTESVPLIAAFGEACAEAAESRQTDDLRIRKLRDYIASELLKIPDSKIIGSGEKMPGILNIAFAGVYGENLMLMCDMRGVCISTGSACSSSNLSASASPHSHVLAAMNVPDAFINSAIRISVGKYTTQADADRIAETVRDCVNLGRMP